jgi:hypothetical protein
LPSPDSLSFLLALASAPLNHSPDLLHQVLFHRVSHSQLEASLVDLVREATNTVETTVAFPTPLAASLTPPVLPSSVNNARNRAAEPLLQVARTFLRSLVALPGLRDTLDMETVITVASLAVSPLLFPRSPREP